MPSDYDPVAVARYMAANDVAGSPIGPRGCAPLTQPKINRLVREYANWMEPTITKFTVTSSGQVQIAQPNPQRGCIGIYVRVAPTGANAEVQVSAVPFTSVIGVQPCLYNVLGPQNSIAVNSFVASYATHGAIVTNPFWVAFAGNFADSAFIAVTEWVYQG
jgi:hypothetical protein